MNESYRITIHKIVANQFRFPKDIPMAIYDVYADYVSEKKERTEEEEAYLKLMPELDPDWSYIPKAVTKVHKDERRNRYEVFRYNLKGELIGHWYCVKDAAAAVPCVQPYEVSAALKRCPTHIFHMSFWLHEPADEILIKRMIRKGKEYAGTC